MRGHFGKEGRKLRRKNYQMDGYWCCSIKGIFEAGSTGVSHLCVSGSLGGSWKRASILGDSCICRTWGTKHLVDMGHEITHRDRGIQEMAAWKQERREGWSGPTAG